MTESKVFPLFQYDCQDGGLEEWMIGVFSTKDLMLDFLLTNFSVVSEDERHFSCYLSPHDVQRKYIRATFFYQEEVLDEALSWESLTTH